MIKGKRRIRRWIKLKRLWCRALVRHDQTAADAYVFEIESMYR